MSAIISTRSDKIQEQMHEAGSMSEPFSNGLLYAAISIVPGAMASLWFGVIWWHVLLVVGCLMQLITVTQIYQSLTRRRRYVMPRVTCPDDLALQGDDVLREMNKKSHLKHHYSPWVIINRFAFGHGGALTLAWTGAYAIFAALGSRWDLFFYAPVVLIATLMIYVVVTWILGHMCLLIAQKE